MRTPQSTYDTLRSFLENFPIIDCHDHSCGLGPRFTDPLNVLYADGYFNTDLHSALGSDAAMAIVTDEKRPLEERWAVLQPAWRAARFTGYGTVIRRMLKQTYGIDELSLEALRSMQTRLANFEDEATFVKYLDAAKIVARIEDVWPDHAAVLNGTYRLTPRGRLAMSLPGLHSVCNAAEIRKAVAAVCPDVRSFDDYLGACRTLCEGYHRYGAVAFKDQAAYYRHLAYTRPERAAAEAVFNRLLANPTETATPETGRWILDDFLFHELLKNARDLALPVQIHTGLLAGLRGDMRPVNAAHLTPLFPMYPDVKFDLFHASWPYADDLCALAKCHPNVTIDFCWAQSIDPVYAQNLMKRLVSCAPYSKVHGYGSDYFGQTDKAWAHAGLARDNIARALADLIAADYLDLDAAQEIATAWLFDNPNRFFKLGLTR